MKARIGDLGALCAVSPQSLRAYAQAEGWEPFEPYGAHSHVYVKASAGKEVIIPGTTSLGGDVPLDVEKWEASVTD